MRRIVLVLTLLMALLAMPAAALAQDAPALPPVVCGDLSDDDCALLEDSQAASLAITTYDATVNFDFALTDVPNLPSDITFGLVSDGSFAIDPAFNARAVELQAAMRESNVDPASMMEEFMALGMGFYDETDFDMTWDITISEEVAALLSQQAGVAIPETLNLPMRLVDGFFYANLDDLAEIVPGLSGWVGFDIVGLLDASMQESLSSLEEGMSDMDPATMGALMGGSMGASPEMQAAMEANTMVERLDDTTVGDVDVAQFLFSFDIGGFLADPAVIDLIVQQVKAQAAMQAEMGDEAPVTDADIEMVGEMLPMFAPMLLSGLQWDTVKTIGLDDLFAYTSETNVEWDLGSLISMAGAMLGEGAMPAVSGSPYFALNVAAENSNINGDVTIEAPEGATIIPLEQMLEDSESSM